MMVTGIFYKTEITYLPVIDGASFGGFFNANIVKESTWADSITAQTWDMYRITMVTTNTVVFPVDMSSEDTAAWFGFVYFFAPLAAIVVVAWLFRKFGHVAGMAGAPHSFTRR